MRNRRQGGAVVSGVSGAKWAGCAKHISQCRQDLLQCCWQQRTNAHRLHHCACVDVSSQRVAWCKVWLRSGDKLQTVQTASRADHRPLAAKLRVKLTYGERQQHTRWHFDELVRSLHSSTVKATMFREKIAQWIEHTQSEWHNICMLAPSEQWCFIADAVHKVAADCFSVQSSPQKVRLSKERLELLKMRREHRRHCALGSWPDLQKLKDVEKQIGKLAREEAYVYKETLRLELKEALRCGSPHEAWKLARRIGGKHRGPRKRRLNAVDAVQPSEAECTDFLARNEAETDICHRVCQGCSSSPLAVAAQSGMETTETQWQRRPSRC
eukprot:TRINITY_DN44362_c0_g1_i2.p1 TRINITY_DN44362_c0_g1~~TRINITY_DN44362_c0_g1_i2.p1  ORF type:complete len:326 (+),score=21.31 TRINITY_DN44362_c0_g1_i2:683-1660(+)